MIKINCLAGDIMLLECQIYMSYMVEFTSLKVAVQEASDFQHCNVDETEFIVVNKMLLWATKGARNPNLNVAFTNACAAVV